ncbi:ATP-grasp domain-containing protein [Anoxynatronum buryatiense]|uniref:Glutathione synthetase, ATP-grasp domain n=1 Tax=Anoxynatronum buryatiense TaxID=489973 RepID=A0AA45WXS1_9CLOT|nr:hypothetical protein [Anoxynatronum buryatiense]SMP65613.1 glutathione synthetase, ATP-grasp domain [Anoxynatronum buryatiense]
MNRKQSVAILVSEKYALTPHADDLALKEHLESFGLQATLVPWDDASVSFDAFDLAIVRSCWDYQHHVSAFLDRMQHIGQQCILVNPTATIVWNSDKRYLQEIAARGIPIVPCHFVDSADALTPNCWPFTAEKLIIKPTVSASGYDTHLVNAHDFSAIQECVRSFGEQKTAIIQPFISSVKTAGERSAVIIDGMPMFVMKKTPADEGFLVHEHWGGTYTETTLTEKDQLFLSRLVDVLNPMPLYMRVDFLYDHQGDPLLLELELIEPNLYLSRNPAGLELLGQAITRILSEPSHFSECS